MCHGGVLRRATWPCPVRVLPLRRVHPYSAPSPARCSAACFRTHRPALFREEEGEGMGWCEEIGARGCVCVCVCERTCGQRWFVERRDGGRPPAPPSPSATFRAGPCYARMGNTPSAQTRRARDRGCVWGQDIDVLRNTCSPGQHARAKGCAVVQQRTLWRPLYASKERLLWLLTRMTSGK